MDPAHVVLLIAVVIAVAAIAGYLIAIILILRHVVNRLVTILGAVQAVTDTTRPVGGIVDDINSELDSGRRLIEGAVERLEERREPREPVGAPTSRHALSDEPPPGMPGGGTSSAPPPPGSAGVKGEEPPGGAEGEPPRGGRRSWWNR